MKQDFDDSLLEGDVQLDAFMEELMKKNKCYYPANSYLNYKDTKRAVAILMCEDTPLEDIEIEDGIIPKYLNVLVRDVQHDFELTKKTGGEGAPLFLDWVIKEKKNLVYSELRNIIKKERIGKYEYTLPQWESLTAVYVSYCIQQELECPEAVLEVQMEGTGIGSRTGGAVYKINKTLGLLEHNGEIVEVHYGKGGVAEGYSNTVYISKYLSRAKYYSAEEIMESIINLSEVRSGRFSVNTINRTVNDEDFTIREHHKTDFRVLSYGGLDVVMYDTGKEILLYEDRDNIDGYYEKQRVGPFLEDMGEAGEKIRAIINALTLANIDSIEEEEIDTSLTRGDS